MTVRRKPAVASALLLVALAAAGCGIGPGKGLGEAKLTVTRDFGARPVAAPVRDRVTESDTAMRLLERNAEISTRYGGGFVQSIDGLEGTERGGRRRDWFFYVDGVESEQGAAEQPLHGGETVWWDYRDWSAALSVPAVVGSWPQPLSGGYEGERHPVAVECLGGGGACDEVQQRLARAGVRARVLFRTPEQGAGSRRAAGAAPGAIRVLVGPWAALREDPAAAQIEAGPQTSGVFARFAPTRRSAAPSPHVGRQRYSGGFELRGLDEDGGVARIFGPDAGLVAATRRYEAPPVWVVTGVRAAGVRAAARLLDSRDLRDRYAVVADGGGAVPVPLGARSAGARTSG